MRGFGIVVPKSPRKRPEDGGGVRQAGAVEVVAAQRFDEGLRHAVGLWDRRRGRTGDETRRLVHEDRGESSVTF